MSNIIKLNENTKALAELDESKKEILNKSVNIDLRMPEFKAKHFVGNAQITPYAKLKQYMIETSTRESNLEDLKYQHNLIKVRIKRQQHFVDNCEDQFDKEEAQIELDHMLFKEESYIRNIAISTKERNMYIDLIDDLINSPDGKLPDGTNLLEAMEDPVKVEQLEREYWTLRMSKQAAMDMIAYGRVGVGNMDSITMLGQDQQYEVLALASDYLVKSETRMNGLLSMANQNNQQKLSSTKLSDTLSLTKAED